MLSFHKNTIFWIVLLGKAMLYLNKNDDLSCMQNIWMLIHQYYID